MTTQPNGATVAENSPVAPLLAPAKAELFVSLKLAVNGNYGSSMLSVVQEALQTHRQTCLNLFFEDLRAGDYKAAHVWYQSFEDLSDVLNSMLNETVALAAQNYYAEEFASNPHGYSHWAKNLPTDKDDRYATFLKKVMPDSEYDEPPASDMAKEGQFGIPDPHN